MPPKKVKRADGRYQVSIVTGRTEAGKPVKKYFYGKTQKEANQKRDEYVASLSGAQVDQHTLVREWTQRWLETYASGGYSSQENHASNVKKINARLGEMRLCDVKQHHIASFAREYAGYSKSFVAKLRYDTQGVFKTAQQNGLIASSPCLDVRWEHAGEGGHRALEAWERELITNYWFVSAAGTWAMLMLYTGMRPGEALALKWKNVRDDCIVITDARHFESDAPVITEGRTKTQAGQRTVPIPPQLAPILSHRGADDELVCRSASGGPITKSAYQKNWKSFINRLENVLNGRDPDALGVRKDIIDTWKPMPVIHPYDLRHTYCSMLYDAGVDVKTAQYLMGHATLEITLKIYTHLSEMKKERSYEALMEYFEKTGCQKDVRMG